MELEGHDRTARLLHVLYILNSNTHGITPRKIATQCGVNVRTTYRDLDALQRFLKVPIWAEGGLWGIQPGSFLPPVNFSLPEAMAIYMSARLLLAQSSVYNPSIETTFRKLSAVLDAPLREEVWKTLEWMKRRKPDESAVHALDVLTRCWTQRRQARIRYWTLGQEYAVERVIEPYFIQPSALSRGTYVIAFCHYRKQVRVFRLERIQQALPLEESYEIPESFDANVYLQPYLGVTATGEPQTVRLRFHPDIARIAQETVWHDSQMTAPGMDGSAIVTMQLAITTDLVSFVLGWGDMVQVLAPVSLRRRVMAAARKVHDMYEEQEASVPGDLPNRAPAMARSQASRHVDEELLPDEELEAPTSLHEPEGVQAEMFGDWRDSASGRRNVLSTHVGVNRT